jgi:hypothetical protein
VTSIRYDGTADTAEAIRAAIGVLKPKQTIHARQEDGRLELDQEWADGQVAPHRWTVQIGQSLDPATGAVLDRTVLVGEPGPELDLQ